MLHEVNGRVAWQRLLPREVILQYDHGHGPGPFALVVHLIDRANHLGADQEFGTGAAMGRAFTTNLVQPSMRLRCACNRFRSAGLIRAARNDAFMMLASSAGREAQQRSGLTQDCLAVAFIACRLIIKTKLLADVGKLYRVGKAAISHHRTQRRQASLREEQPRLPARGVQAHQAALDQPLGEQRDLGLARACATPPYPHHKPVRYAGQRREEHVQFTPYVVPLAGCEAGRRCRLEGAHDGDIRTRAARVHVRALT